MMPYLVKATGQKPKAVATLEEAKGQMREAVAESCDSRWWERDRVFAEIEAIPGSGGSVGPLPDGTVIEVERVTYVRLACDGNWTWPADETDYSSPDRHADEVLAAYNEAQR